MFDFKRLGKAAVCVLLCVACLAVANPVSALSTLPMVTNTAAVPEKPASLPEAPAVTATSHLVSYVRYSPYSGTVIIGCLEEGTKLTVLEAKGDFYKIDCYDMNGYIAKSQVAVDETGDYYVKTVPGSSETAYLPAYSAQDALELMSQIVNISKKYIGVPYVSAGSTPRGFDCSGYTQYVFREAGISINRSVGQQLRNGVIVAKEDLQAGDLLIFSNTTSVGFASHVGIYLGNGKLIHCGSSRGVTIVELDSAYYTKHYQCARRVILPDVSVTATMPTIGSITGSIGSGWRNEG